MFSSPQRLPQIHHIHELHPALEDGMAVVVGEEALYRMGTDESAFLIEWDRQRTVACADLEDGMRCSIFILDELDQGAPVSPSLRRQSTQWWCQYGDGRRSRGVVHSECAPDSSGSGVGSEVAFYAGNELMRYPQ